MPKITSFFSDNLNPDPPTEGFDVILVKDSINLAFLKRNYSLWCNGLKVGSILDNVARCQDLTVDIHIERLVPFSVEVHDRIETGINTITKAEEFRIKVINEDIAPQIVFPGFEIKNYRAERGIFDARQQLVAFRVIAWKDSDREDKVLFRIFIKQGLEQKVRDRCVVSLCTATTFEITRKY
jgi:hypothetical protein